MLVRTTLFFPERKTGVLLLLGNSSGQLLLQGKNQDRTRSGSLTGRGELVEMSRSSLINMFPSKGVQTKHRLGSRTNDNISTVQTLVGHFQS